jgi:hypothetical protein
MSSDPRWGDDTCDHSWENVQRDRESRERIDRDSNDPRDAFMRHVDHHSPASSVRLCRGLRRGNGDSGALNPLRQKGRRRLPPLIAVRSCDHEKPWRERPRMARAIRSRALFKGRSRHGS